MPTIIGFGALAENLGLDGGKGTTALMYAASKYAPPAITGFVAATMSSADSNLICASTILMKDIYQRFINPDIEDKRLIFMTRMSNILICIVSIGIALFKINLITLNLFAFALRTVGPFAAYALGMVVPNATKNSGIVSIVVGSVAVVGWQIFSINGENTFGILPIVFGCFWGVVTFFLVTYIEKKMGKPAAPSAYLDGSSQVS